jgi:hypothetical protein
MIASWRKEGEEQLVLFQDHCMLDFVGFRYIRLLLSSPDQATRGSFRTLLSGTGSKKCVNWRQSFDSVHAFSETLLSEAFSFSFSFSSKADAMGRRSDHPYIPLRSSISGNVVLHRGQAERQMLWGLDLIP